MSDDEDDYVAFGVALKPLEEADTIRKKPIAVEEQIVRDVNGIRRFHGAFTGGFSAGHFNTVNTPQGWYPKQFKSSRENKSDKTNQRPEDFMDDEDVGAFGFAAQALKTKSSFQGGAEPSAPPPQTGASRSAIPLGGLLEQLVRPSNSTVGESLLMKQGWRPGSGVGPRATKASKISRLASHVKTYGCSMPTSRKEREEDHREDTEVDPIMEKYQDFLFAPDEIPLNIANPKDNFFGIGYSGLDRPGVGVGGSGGGYSVRTSLNNTTSSKKKFSISGEAFGVGADEEDDDMEVYNRNDMGQYDFSLDIKGEERRERRNEKGSRWDDDARSQKRGIDCVAGFCPATSKSMIKKHYQSPLLPPSWRPRANPGQRQKPSRFSPAEVGSEREQEQVRKSRWDQKGASSGSNPSIDERRSKLFPDECNSTNNAVKEEDVKNDPVELPDFLLNYQPEEDAATRGQGQVPFKPFARNEAKQLRYEQYLVCVANNRREALSILQPRSMTEWEKERERVEFERASMLFKPMKGVIGSRFVSAGESEDADKGEGGLDAGVDTEEGQARRAADMKMFGKLTRSVEEWHPAKLLCVRFNVAHPYGDYSVVGTREKAKRDTGVSNVFAMVGMEKEEEGNKSSRAKEEDEVEVKPEPGEPMIKLDNEPAQVKPPPDLFKAIFVDTDSDSDSEMEEEDNPSTDSNANKATSINPGNHLPTPVVTSAPKPWEKKEGNILRSKEPARGIFANIDLDSLNRKHPRDTKETGLEDEEKAKARVSVKSGGNLSVANQTVRTVLGIRKVEDESSEDEFGPKLPPAMVQKSIVISSDSEEDGGRREGKKKKKEKKKHKDKKKYKSKKEKRSRHYSSSDSSGERRKRKGVEKEEKSKHKKKRRYSS